MRRAVARRDEGRPLDDEEVRPRHRPEHRRTKRRSSSARRCRAWAAWTRIVNAVDVPAARRAKPGTPWNSAARTRLSAGTPSGSGVFAWTVPSLSMLRKTFASQATDALQCGSASTFIEPPRPSTPHCRRRCRPGRPREAGRRPSAARSSVAQRLPTDPRGHRLRDEDRAERLLDDRPRVEPLEAQLLALPQRGRPEPHGTALHGDVADAGHPRDGAQPGDLEKVLDRLGRGAVAVAELLLDLGELLLVDDRGQLLVRLEP